MLLYKIKKEGIFVAYYLMVEKRRGEYLPINIKNSKYYQNIRSKFNKPCAHSLQEIDSFTMMFNDEIELRERLVEEGILSLSFFEKPLSIRILKKGIYSKVPYDFLYQKDLEYVMEPERIIKLVMERYYQNDFLFLKRLASYFSQVHECETTGPEVVRLSEASLYQGYRHMGLEEIDKNGDMMVARMLKLLILKHYECGNGYIKYYNDINYRNLHDLIAFINNYDKKHIQSEEIVIEAEEGVEIQSDSQELSEEPKKSFTKSKKMGKKRKYNLDGQMSFDC